MLGLMSEIEIRPAQEADYIRLADIWLQGQTPFDGGVMPPGLHAELQARLPREVAQNGWTVFAAAFDGRIAGFLALDTANGVLRQLFIDENLRSRGIGKALLDFAKREMPAGFWLRTHSLNVRGHRFYEREGLMHLRDEPHPRFPETLFRIYTWAPG
jgi:GNAT superfamily N-acetyltransferase